jgi:hypothetical protein
VSDIIRAYKARVPMPRASSDDAPVPGFSNTYLAVQREAERNERANQRGMARIARAIKQSSFPQSAQPIQVAVQTGIQQVYVYP